MKKIFCLILAMLMILSLITGCGGKPETDTVEADAPAADGSAASNSTEEKKEPVILNMALNSAWAGLMPYNSASAGNYGNLIIGLIHDHLYTINPDGTFGPRGGKELGSQRGQNVHYLPSG